MVRAWTLLFTGCLLYQQAILPAAAQTNPPPEPFSQGEALSARQHPRPFIEDFKAANTTHDGHLTLQQARAAAGTVPHMDAVARRFSQIDIQHKGYITLRDIRAYVQRLRATRAAAGQGPPK